MVCIEVQPSHVVHDRFKSGSLLDLKTVRDWRDESSSLDGVLAVYCNRYSGLQSCRYPTVYSEAVKG